MTRGTLVLLVDGCIFASTEFNGDQYPEGHGSESYALMKGVTDLDSFAKAINTMNRHYGYADVWAHLKANTETDEGKQKYDWLLDMTTGYYELNNEKFGDKWFSDYLYIKNLEAEPVTFMCRPDDEHTDPFPVILMPNDVICLNAGSPVSADHIKSFPEENTKGNPVDEESIEEMVSQASSIADMFVNNGDDHLRTEIAETAASLADLLMELQKREK